MILGTVHARDNNEGLQIIIDGEDEATEKKYHYLASYVPAAGDRVLIEEIGDSYVVIGKVIDQYSSSGQARHASSADSATNATNATNATSAAKATQDESGNNIKSTYAADLTVSNGKIQLKNKNGGTIGTNATLANVNSVYNHKQTNSPIYFGLLGNDLYFSTSSSYGWKKVTGS